MIDYIELHALTDHSFLRASSSVEDLVARAVELRMIGLGIANYGGIYDAPDFFKAAHQAGIKPILGAELTLHDGSQIVLVVKNHTGYCNLGYLLTVAHHNAPKGQMLLPKGGLEGRTDGLIALSGSYLGRIPSAVLRGDYQAAVKAAYEFIRLFGKDHFWIELQHHLHPKDNQLVADLVDLAEQVGVGVVATNNVQYAVHDRHKLHDVKQCIRTHTTLDEATELYPNSEYYLKSGAELAPLFQAYPHALSNTRLIADQCDFELPRGMQEFPVFPTPNGMSADDYLRQLCLEKADELKLPPEAYDRLEKELAVIRECGLSNPFLIIKGSLNFADEKDIMYQGRGSSNNSFVCFLVGITPINPFIHDLVSERFLSGEGKIRGDLDIDFEAKRRDLMPQNLVETYGSEHVAALCTFITFQPKSAIQDVGKVFGLPLDALRHITNNLDTYDVNALRESASLREIIGSRVDSQVWQFIFDMVVELIDSPRGTGTHASAIIITGPPVSDYAPTEPATKEKTTVIQLNKHGVNERDLVKCDYLGLRTPGAIKDALKIIEQTIGHRPELSKLQFDDETVYDTICNDSLGIFQVESPAQEPIAARMKPRNLSTLGACISMVRPAPIAMQSHKKILRIVEGIEPLTYKYPLLINALKNTWGVMLYQDQGMKIAHDVAGFTYAQGETLRRAFGAKNAPKEIERLHQAFIEGALAKGVPLDIAESIFDDLRAFQDYGFLEGHALSFAIWTYRAAWLKRYYPLAFYISLLNNQPMGFWPPQNILDDARLHGIPVYPVDINHSAYLCTIRGEGIQLGFNQVRGLGENAANRIIEARRQQPFANLEDYYRCVHLSREDNDTLAAAGAFDVWDSSRQESKWILGLQRRPGEVPLLQHTKPVGLPTLTTADKARMEYAATHISTGPHPMTFYRARLNKRGTLNSRRLKRQPAGRKVWAAGQIAAIRFPPSAEGVGFLTIRDEYGAMTFILSAEVYSRHRKDIRAGSLLMAVGTVQRKGPVISLSVDKCVPLNEQTLSESP